MNKGREDLNQYKEAFLSWIKTSNANHLQVIRDTILRNMDERFSLAIEKKELTKQEVFDVKTDLLFVLTEKEILYQ